MGNENNIKEIRVGDKFESAYNTLTGEMGLIWTVIDFSNNGQSIGLEPNKTYYSIMQIPLGYFKYKIYSGKYKKLCKFITLSK